MLREVGSVSQDAPGLRRRWFRDEYFDLYLWEKPGGEVAAFQLCYDRSDRERSLRWSEAAGFGHEGVSRPEDYARALRRRRRAGPGSPSR